MDKLFKNYIPGVCMAFTVIVLWGCVTNLLLGDNRDGFVPFLLEVVVYLVVAVVVDAITTRIDFKTYVGNFLMETVSLYPITMAFAYFGHWFGFRPTTILLYTVLYLLIMIGIHYYFYYMTKKEAESINRYLNVREECERNGRSTEV